MKKIMKKALSLMLALVMMLSLAPMTAMAADGSVGDPYVLTTESNVSVSVDGGDSVYVYFESYTPGNWDVTVSGDSMGMAVYAFDDARAIGNWDYAAVAFMTKGNNAIGTIETTRSVYSYYIEITNTNMGGTINATVSVVGSSTGGDQGGTTVNTGTKDEPLNLVLDSFESVETKGEYYWYGYTATSDCRVLFNLGTDGFVECFVEDEYVGAYDTDEDDADGAITPTTGAFYIDLMSGETVKFALTDVIGDETGVTGYYATLPEPGSSDYPASLVMGESTKTSEETMGYPYYYEYTATRNGVLTIVPGETTQVSYKVNGTGWYHELNNWEYITETVEIELSRGDYIAIEFGTSTWDAESMSITASYAIDPNDNGLYVDGVMATDDTKTYSDSATTLVVGNNTVPVCKDADYTLYYFTASEDGKYTFAINGEAEVYNCGSMSYLIAGTDGSNTVTVELKKDAEVVIGVSGVDVAECTITVTKATASKDVVKDYVNTVTPKAFTYEGDANKLFYVYVKDGKADVAVKGEDGFYHYGDANGPILYVNLEKVQGIDYYTLSETALKDGLMVKLEDGSVINYSDAVNAYVSCMDSKIKVYPLTDDLKEVLVAYGNAQGWYDYDGTLNYLFTDANGDRVKVNEETAWLFACCYAGAVNEAKTQVKWTVGGKEDLVITFAAEFRDFADEVKINGVKLDPKYYTVAEGSTIITIDADYLATLALGEYTVAASFYGVDGEIYELTSTFVVAESTVPATGDSANFALWVAVLGLGVVAMAGSVVMKKREF